MTTRLHFGRDDQGYNAFAPDPSENIYNASLVNGAATSITLPSNFPAWIISISVEPGKSIWVDFTGATAAIPAGATLASATSELNPGSRTMAALKDDGTANSVSFITANSTAEISVSLYGVQFAN